MKEHRLTYETALALLNDYIAKHSMRHTAEREMVLEQVCGMQQPFTADQLAEECQKIQISRGTVYNTLSLLVLARILYVKKREHGQAASEYELMTSRRSYARFVCSKCGREVEFHDKAIDRLIVTRRYTNFVVQHYGLTVYGECKTCRRKKVQ